jgi:hypothetical protein
MTTRIPRRMSFVASEFDCICYAGAALRLCVTALAVG